MAHSNSQVVQFKIRSNWASGRPVVSCTAEASLTHQGWVTHICVSELTTIGSDNGLLPGQWQAIIWTNAAILSTGPSGTNFSDISTEIPRASLKINMSENVVYKMTAILSQPQCVKIKFNQNTTRNLRKRCIHCSGSLEPETLWSRSEALHEYGLIHGGWHFNIHQDFDTRGR